MVCFSTNGDVLEVGVIFCREGSILRRLRADLDCKKRDPMLDMSVVNDGALVATRLNDFSCNFNPPV